MFTIALSVVSTIVVNLNVNAVHPKELQGLSKKLFLCWLPRILRMNHSPNTFSGRDIVLSVCNKSKITLHLSQCGHTDSDKIVIQQWKFVASIVDRMCLMLSLTFSFISVTVFLIYAI